MFYFLFFIALFAYPTFTAPPPDDLRPYLQRVIPQVPAKGRFPDVFKATPEQMAILQREFFSDALPSLEVMRDGKFSRVYRLGPTVAGAIGEMYLNAWAKKWVHNHSGFLFVDGIQYDAWNADGARPDGLVVSEIDGRLVLHQILESKMGASPYSRPQVYGSARLWQIAGLTMPNGVTYAPAEILVPVGKHYRQLSQMKLREDADLDQIEARVILVVSERKHEPFKGAIVQTPFSTAELTNLSNRFVGYAYLGLEATRGQVEHLLSSQRPRQRFVSVPTGLREPVIPASRSLAAKMARNPNPRPSLFDLAPLRTRELVPFGRDPALDQRIIDLALHHFRMPDPALEQDLSRYAGRIGGRMKVFADIYDAPIRKMLAEHEVRPAINPMEKWLQNADLDGDRVRSLEMLGIYLDAYAPPGKVNPFIDRLQVHPKWRPVLKDISLDSLRKGCGPDTEKLGVSGTP